VAREAGQWGLVKQLNLLQPLNTNSVDADIYALDTGGPAILNNGIHRDGGITELYEYTKSIGSNAFVSSNGKVVAISGASVLTGSSLSQSILDSTGVLNSTNYFTKAQLGPQYLDAVVSTSVNAGIPTVLAAACTTTDEIQLTEMTSDGQTILNTESVPAVGARPGVTRIAIARANVLTYASLKATSGLVYSDSTGTVYYWKANTRYVQTMTIDSFSGGFVAYYNGGTVVFSNGAAVAYSTTPFAATTAITFNPGYGAVAGAWIGDAYPNQLDSAATTLALNAVTTSTRCPIFRVGVSAIGAVTTSTLFGTYFNGDGVTITEATFNMADGIVTPYGCSGIATNGGSTAPTYYGVFQSATFLPNDPTGTSPVTWPQLDAPHTMVDIRSYANQIALIAGRVNAVATSMEYGNLINDFSGGSFDADIMAGNIYAGSAKTNLFHPFTWRSMGATRYDGVLIYKLNSGRLVTVTTSTTPRYTELAPGVVAINNMGSYGAIIDLNEQKLYNNYSSYTTGFAFNYTANSSSTMYMKIFNKYSSSLDQGIIYGDTAKIGNMGYPRGWSVYNGPSSTTPGAYQGDCATVATYWTFSDVAVHQGSYVFNANIPPGGDATFSGGGVQMLNATAIATQSYNGSNGYWGYYLFPSSGGSNLLPFKDADVFLLFGTYYAFDGTYIYGVQLSAGSTGTVVGAPVRLAYAIGLRYLCVSEAQAYFYSPYDNAVFSYNGGRSLNKYAEFTKKSLIQSGYYSTRDNALYLVTTDSVLSVREPEDTPSVNTRAIQMTENTLPTYTNIVSTSEGLCFINGTSATIRTYYAGSGTLIKMAYQTGFHAPDDGQTMQIQRILARVYVANKALGTTIQLVHDFMRVDGSTGSESTSISSLYSLVPQTNLYPSTTLYPGYQHGSSPPQNAVWIEWTPPTSNVLASSVGLRHTTSEQKIVLLELFMYYQTSSEVMPLTQITG